MCSSIKIWVAAVAVWLSAPVVAQQQTLACDTHELANATSLPRYNALVCTGVEYMDRGDYLAAAEVLEEAMNVRFFESANYVLFPRLALAYFRAGDTLKAESNLRKAELSLSIKSGVIKCVERGEDQYVLRRKKDGRIGLQDIPMRKEEEDIVERMCGSLRGGGGLFAVMPLEELRWLVQSIMYYFQVKDALTGTETGRG